MPKNIDLRSYIMAAVLFTTFSAISSVSAEDKANVEAIERGRFNAESSARHATPFPTSAIPAPRLLQLRPLMRLPTGRICPRVRCMSFSAQRIGMRIR